VVAVRPGDRHDDRHDRRGRRPAGHAERQVRQVRQARQPEVTVVRWFRKAIHPERTRAMPRRRTERHRVGVGI
jgi:hypothetical protein